MIRWVRTPIFVALGFFLMAGCEEGGPTEPNLRVDYATRIEPVLQTSCATSGCHDAQTRTAGLSLGSWEEMFMGSHGGAVIIPYSGLKSPLLHHINRDSLYAPVAHLQMPPSGPLPEADVDAIRRWIDEGASNENGLIAFSTAPQGRVYVTNQGEDQVAVIDRATNLLARLIPIGVLNDNSSPPEAPHNVVVDHQGVYYFVNLIAAGEVWKMRVSDNATIGKLTLEAGSSPAQVVISGDGKTAYVSNLDVQGSIRRVLAFSTESMTVTREFSDQRIWASHGLQLTHDGRYLWSANQVSDNIMVVDLIADTLVFLKADASVPDVPVNPAQFYGPYQVVFTPDDAYAFVSCRVSNEVRVFSTQTLALETVIPVGTTPLILDITPNGQFVYVANRGSSVSPSTSVTVINVASRTVETTIEGVGRQPHGVAVTPDGEYVYVSTENLDGQDAPHHPTAGSKTPSFVAVIDVSTQSIVRWIQVGAFGAGVAVTPL